MNPNSRARLREPRVQNLLAAVALLVVAAMVVLVHVEEYTTISPIDELQHIDYLDKAAHGQVLEGGELVGEEAMRSEACRGIDSPGFVVPPCNQPDLLPEQFQEAGFNTATSDPPVYYWVTGWVARALVALPGFSDFVAAGRALGTLWLFGGLLVTFLLARRSGATLAAAGGVCLLLATAPAVVHPSATITSDAPAMLVGGLLGLVTWSALRARVHPAWTGLAALLAVLVKVTGVAAVGLVLVFALLMMLPWGNRSTVEGDAADPDAVVDRRRGLLTMGWIVLGTLVGLGGWFVVTSSVTPDDAAASPMSRFNVDSIGSDQVLTNLLSVVSPVASPYVPLIIMSTLLLVIAGVVNLLLIAGPLGAAWSRSTTRGVQLLATATVAAMVISGPVFVLIYFFVNSAYIAIPARYGLGLLPFAGAMLAAVVSQRKKWDYVLLAFGLVSVITLMKNLLT